MTDRATHPYLRHMEHQHIEPRPSPPEGLWSADETAAFLGVPRKAVYQLRREGLLQGILLSERRVRFLPSDVLAFAENRRDG